MSVRDPFGELDGQDAYDLLGVADDASAEEIRRAFKMQIRRWHPDQHLGSRDLAEAERRARHLTAAREILLNRRADYDRRRDDALDGEEFADPDFVAADEAPVAADPWTAAWEGSGRPPPPAPPPPARPAGPWPQPTVGGYSWPAPPPAPPPRPPARGGRPKWVVISMVLGLWGLLLGGCAVAVVYNEYKAAEPAEPAVAVPKRFAGTWSGRLAFPNSADRAKMLLVLWAGKRSGVNRYPDDGCESRIIPLRLEDGVLTAYEDIRRGYNCSDGEVRISLKKGKLRVAFHDDDTGKWNITGSLSRQRGSV